MSELDQQRKKLKKDDSEEERALEELLFGKISSKLNVLQKNHEKSKDGEVPDVSMNDNESGNLVKGDEEVDYEDINFSIDTLPDHQKIAKPSITTPQTSAVWHDEDDEEIEIDLNAVNRLKKLKFSEKFLTQQQKKKGKGKSIVTGEELNELLQERFNHQRTNVWATLLPQQIEKMQGKKREESSIEDEDDQETEGILENEDYQLLQEVDSMITKKKLDKWIPLRENKLTLHRLQDVNYDEPASTRISATHFHRNNEMVLVASDDKFLRLFKINEESGKNSKILGIQFSDLSIKQSKFIGMHHEGLVACGRRPYYYHYDIATGQISKIPKSPTMQTTTFEHMEVSPDGSRLGFVGSRGYIHIADSYSKQWIADLKINSTLKSISFLNDHICITSGYDAEVYFWDLRYPNGKCFAKFSHEDGTATSHISSYLPNNSEENNFYSLTNAYLSIGAISGVDSIYEGLYDSQSGYYQFSPSGAINSRPKPLRSVMNLTTKITASAFHPSGQVLAIASYEKKDQMKLIHLPSCSVYQNWPLQTTPLHHVETVEFSPNGKYLCIGNKRGKVLLYQLNHFV